MNTISQMKQIALLMLTLSFFACSEKKDNSQTFFPKPPEEKLDSVGTWLSQDSNYLKKEYLPFFEKNFNQQIAANNIDSAARLLDIAGKAAWINYSLDTFLVQKHLDFLAKYENQIKPRFRSGFYYNLGEMYLDNEDYEKSITYFRQNIFSPKDYYDEHNIAITHQGMSYYFLIKGQHDSSIIYGQKGMAFFEKHQDKAGAFVAHYDLSGSYRYMYNFPESEKNTKKALEIAKELKDSSYIFDALTQMATVHDEMGSDSIISTTNALVNFEKQWKHNNPKYTLEAQSVLAKQFLRDSNYIETGKILNRIAPLYQLVKKDYYTENYIDVLGNFEVATKRPLTFKKLYLEKVKEAEADKYFAHLINYNNLLSLNAVNMNNYKAAYEYLNEIVNARDSMQKIKVREAGVELDKKYQTEKKEAQIKQQADDAYKKNIYIGFLVIGLLSLFYFYRTLLKKNTTISQQNELNEHTIAILSHDIKEPLLGVKLLLKKLNKDDPFVAQASQSLENQINSVSGILTNLLKMKKLSLVKKDKNATANVNTVVKNVTQELSVAIQSKGLTIENELNDDLMLPIAPEKLQIILHNLLTNAVKYSFQDQIIKIYQEKNGFVIQDFGVGLSDEQRSKLMREVTASQKGTNAERGNGLGLFLVGAMLEEETVKVIFDSSEVGGTIVKILG